jgi:hypothetical protein
MISLDWDEESIRHNSPASGTELPEADGLLGREINNNEAIDACLLAVLQQSLLSIAENRIVVSHEEYWGSQPSLSGISNHLQN